MGREAARFLGFGVGGWTQGQRHVPTARLFGWHHGLDVLILGEDGQHDAIRGQGRRCGIHAPMAALLGAASPRCGRTARIIPS